MKKIIFFLFLFFSFLGVSNAYTLTEVKTLTSQPTFTTYTPILWNEGETQKMIYLTQSGSQDFIVNLYNITTNTIISSGSLHTTYSAPTSIKSIFEFYYTPGEKVNIIQMTDSNARYYIIAQGDNLSISGYYNGPGPKGIFGNKFYIQGDSINGGYYDFNTLSFQQYLGSTEYNNYKCGNSINTDIYLNYQIDGIGATILYYYQGGHYYRAYWRYGIECLINEAFVNYGLSGSPYQQFDLESQYKSYVSKAKLSYVGYQATISGKDEYFLSLCSGSGYTLNGTIIHNASFFGRYLGLTSGVTGFDYSGNFYYKYIYSSSNKSQYFYKYFDNNTFLPRGFQCSDNYAYSSFIEGKPTKMMYTNKYTSSTHILYEATLTSSEQQQIYSGDPGSGEGFSENAEFTKEQITEDLFNFDINGDGEVSAWEYALAPFTFIKNLVLKLYNGIINFWEIIKAFLNIGNIGLIPTTHAASGGVIGGAEFFDNFSSTFAGEGENEVFNGLAKQGRNTIIAILLLIVLLFGIYSLKK